MRSYNIKVEPKQAVIFRYIRMFKKFTLSSLWQLQKKSRLLGMVRLLTFFQARTMKFCVLRLKNCKSLRFIYINIVSLKQENIRHVYCRNNSIINSHALIKLIGLQWYSDFLTEISPNLATGETFWELLPVLKLLNSWGQHYKKTPYQTKLTPKHCKSNAGIFFGFFVFLLALG